MAILCLIIFVNHRKARRILYAIVPGALVFMGHSIINTAFWIIRLITFSTVPNEQEYIHVLRTISDNFLNYIDVADVGIFILQVALFVALLHKLMGTTCKNSDFVILFTSIFSSVLFYNSASNIFTLLVPQDFVFVAKVMALIWLPSIIAAMMLVSYTIGVVLDFLESLIPMPVIDDEVPCDFVILA